MSLPLLGLLANIPAMSTCFTTLSLRFLRPIYFFFTSFYSHGLVAKFNGLPRPFYYIFTSYYPFGLIGHHSGHASPLSLLIYSPGFPDPFTFSLPLIILMGLLLHLLDFLSPFISFLPYNLHGPADHQSCHSSPLGLFPYFFNISPLIFFSSSFLLGFFCY